jgi:hypothetical protein
LVGDRINTPEKLEWRYPRRAGMMDNMSDKNRQDASSAESCAGSQKNPASLPGSVNFGQPCPLLGTYRILCDAGHNIQFDRPDAVVAAISEVVSEVRSDPTEPSAGRLTSLTRLLGRVAVAANSSG